MRKKIQLSLPIGVLAVMAISGCSAGGTFRNRNFDYTRHDVKQINPLVTPKGVQPATTAALYRIPAGKAQYPAGPVASMAPPSLSQKQVLAAMKQAVKQAKAKVGQSALKAKAPTPKAAKGSLSQQLHSLNQQMQALKHKEQQVSGKPVVAAAPAKPSKPITNVLTLPAKWQHAHLPKDVAAAVPASAALAKTSAKSTAKHPEHYQNWIALSGKPKSATLAQNAKKGSVTKARVVKQQSTLPPISGRLIRNQDDSSQLILQSNYYQAWTRIAPLLKKQGLVIVSANAKRGFYFIAPQHKAARGHTRLLFIAPVKHEVYVTLYNTAGRPDRSDEAYALLNQLKAALAAE